MYCSSFPATDWQNIGRAAIAWACMASDNLPHDLLASNFEQFNFLGYSFQNASNSSV